MELFACKGKTAFRMAVKAIFLQKLQRGHSGRHRRYHNTFSASILWGISVKMSQNPFFRHNEPIWLGSWNVFNTNQVFYIFLSILWLNSVLPSGGVLRNKTTCQIVKEFSRKGGWITSLPPLDISRDTLVTLISDEELARQATRTVGGTKEGIGSQWCLIEMERDSMEVHRRVQVGDRLITNIPYRVPLG